ncbi:hypothetical protein GUITHDRAFT_75194 [Guillardia theta CCMP2712]|uniref:Uncharacterized protein n=1 Tax=Guillardia theta (strain CCMP2712) TaxID=905079 RepID=L1IY54_GUITC|nr:hypothetical protein GUITHDRAFT_75194 [Guillardia theta CCMP2712]EKX40794.1 hypothetical protein GUITHDRAFT_75194 [Guillardia theta CCMP2712]|eukprot:XP_005827774.1 hypothetical protein GUITHDRAFT_75194 [Guillardia theta CCMP2712]
MEENTGNSTLISAAEGGSERCTTFLLNLQPPKIDVDAAGMMGNTALHRACRRGHSNIVRMLIEAGADVNKPNSKQQFPLHVAAFYRHRGCVENLLKSDKIDTGVLDRKGRTPAEDTKDPDIAELIRRCKA